MDLRHRIADAIARGHDDTPASVHPCMEDYRDHADKVMEVVDAHRRSANDGPDAWDFSRMEHETDVLQARVRELEEENTRLRDAIADRIFAAEQECQTAITKNPTSASLNGHLVGLQRARDIVTARQLKEEKS